VEQPPQNLSPFIFTQKWRRSQSDVPCVDTEIHQRSPPRTAPQIHHVMYFIYFFCVCHMHAEPTANQGLDAVACQGIASSQTADAFSFPTPRVQMYFPLSPLSSKLLFIQTPSAHTQPKIYVLLLYYNTCLWLRDKLFFLSVFPCSLFCVLSSIYS
jgi:hypothetical protein